jgi:hypothetical protein
MSGDCKGEERVEEDGEEEEEEGEEEEEDSEWDDVAVDPSDDLSCFPPYASANHSTKMRISTFSMLRKERMRLMPESSIMTLAMRIFSLTTLALVWSTHRWSRIC